MEHTLTHAARLKELMTQLDLCKNSVQEQHILNELKRLDVDDADEWTLITNRKGEVIAGIRSWHVCFANTEFDPITCSSTKCLALTPTKVRSTGWAHAPVSPKFRRYCECGARLRLSRDQLVEIMQTTSSDQLHRFYTRAMEPFLYEEDVIPLLHESELTPSSPWDLCTLLKCVESTHTPRIVDRSATPRIGDRAAWEGMPKLLWSEIFAMVGVKFPQSGK